MQLGHSIYVFIVVLHLILFISLHSQACSSKINLGRFKMWSLNAVEMYVKCTTVVIENIDLSTQVFTLYRWSFKKV